MTELRWTQSNGGPLILLEEAALPSWRGVTNLEDPTDPSTDYGRATDPSRPEISLISVGSALGLLLGDEPRPAAMHVRGGSLLLLRTFEAHRIQLEDLEGAFERTRAGVTRDLSFRLSSDAVLHLFDSAFAGCDAHRPPLPSEERLPGISVPWRRGTYRVSTRVSASTEDLLIHELVRADS